MARQCRRLLAVSDVLRSYLLQPCLRRPPRLPSFPLLLTLSLYLPPPPPFLPLPSPLLSLYRPRRRRRRYRHPVLCLVLLLARKRFHPADELLQSETFHAAPRDYLMVGVIIIDNELRMSDLSAQFPLSECKSFARRRRRFVTLFCPRARDFLSPLSFRALFFPYFLQRTRIVGVFASRKKKGSDKFHADRDMPARVEGMRDFKVPRVRDRSLETGRVGGTHRTQ